MSFGFPAKYRRVINKSEHSDFREKLMNSLNALSFKVKRMNGDKIILKTRWSVLSWGEIIKIDFTDDKTVTITSRCVFPLQLIDYGKNKENVERLVLKLSVSPNQVDMTL